MSYTHLPAILAQAEPDWAAVANTPIQATVEPLVKVEAQPRLQVCSAYFADQIPGALPDIWLRADVAQRLDAVLALLPEHMGLRLLDGWRPFEVQVALRQLFADDLCLRMPDASEAERLQVLNQFVAMPRQNDGAPSPHLTGGSVDLTLFDVATGVALDMGSAFDSPELASWTAFYETDETRDGVINYRRRLLCHAMAQAGFTNLPTEWWHFDYGNQLWAHYSGRPHALYAAAQP
ncbi:MAG: D-alanyl-D-alanine dipeptidase [Neisseriaceae bacterium]|nr:D-alanyl-D-alanine dipeptidase [Neisseriaceae bacterium]